MVAVTGLYFMSETRTATSFLAVSMFAMMLLSIAGTCVEVFEINVPAFILLRKSPRVTGASISEISYEDILVFQNWKKNVE